MKIRIETKYGNYEIEEKGDDQDINEMIDIFQRLLLSMTFAYETVKDGFIDKAEEIKEEDKNA